MNDATLIPAQSEDAYRQQLAARAFALVSDYFAGSDTMRRMEPGNTGAPILGPGQSALDVGVGAGGEVFIRGRSGQIGVATGAPAQPAPAMSLMASPLVMLGLAGLAAWLLFRE